MRRDLAPFPAQSPPQPPLTAAWAAKVTALITPRTWSVL